MNKPILSQEQIRNDLAHFTGTDRYHLHRLNSETKIYLTDGCNYVRTKLNAYWLFDLIISWQLKTKVQEAPFQVWKLAKQNDETWLCQCEDGNNNVLAFQRIEFSDFPLDEIKIWVVDGVALLPSEY